MGLIESTLVGEHRSVVDRLGSQASKRQVYEECAKQMTTVIRGTTITCHATKARYTFFWRLPEGWTYKGKLWGVPPGHRPKIVKDTGCGANLRVRAVPMDESSSEED